MAGVLTAEQRGRYHRDGIVYPIDVLSPDAARRYRDACDDLERQLGGKPRTIEVRQMHLHFRWAYELATAPRILDAVEDVLGPDLLIWATELFAKHPQDGVVSIGWHRDQPYMGFDATTAATAWVALSDCTPANGCMQAVPGEQRLEAAAAGPGGKADRLNEQFDRGGAIDVVLRAGQMSIHDSLIPHGSNPNRSSEKRVGLAIRFVTPQARPLHGRPPGVLARGSDPYGHFELVGPPPELSTAEALSELKRSATQHFDAMLQNLKR